MEEKEGTRFESKIKIKCKECGWVLPFDEYIIKKGKKVRDAPSVMKLNNKNIYCGNCKRILRPIKD